MWYSATPVVLALILISSLFGSSKSHEISEENLEDEEVLPSDSQSNCQITCTQNKLICGSDGLTYSHCQFQRLVQCEGKRIQIKRHGKCTEESKCRAERVRAQKARRPLPAAFVPECKDDGSYAEVQCHTPTGYCWCVTDSGMPVPGSSVINKKPICNRNSGKQNVGKQNSKRTTPRRRKDRKGCSQVDRSNFNEDLVKIFLSEYNRLPTSTPALTKAVSVIDSREKRAVEWKFTELDRNGDSDLDKKELQALRRMLKKVVRPRPCARTFTRTCDQNHDKKISRAEWTLCLGVDMNNEQTEHADKEDSSSIERVSSSWNQHISTLSTHVRPTDTNIEMTDDDVADCPSDRQMALDDLKHSEGKVFVPECSPDGKYSKLQCFKPTSYCWCVNPDNGKTIAGTTLLDAKPDCDKSFRYNKPIKGCNPERKKQQFLSELLDSLVKEMVLSNQSIVEQKTDISTNSLEVKEKAAVQKLRMLDTNNNQVIDKKEWKDFKNEIKKRKIMRKCGRNFLKYCDDDNNKKVTEDEWISCLGLRDTKIITPPVRRRGKNPLLILNK